MVACRAHDTLLFVTTSGRAYSTLAYKVPEASRTAGGTAITQVRYSSAVPSCLDKTSRVGKARAASGGLLRFGSNACRVLYNRWTFNPSGDRR